MKTLTIKKIEQIYLNALKTQNPENLESLYFSLILSSDNELKNYYSTSLHNWSTNMAKNYNSWLSDEIKTKSIIRLLEQSLNLSSDNYTNYFSLALTYYNFATKNTDVRKSLELQEVALEMVKKSISIKKSEKSLILYATILIEIADIKSTIKNESSNAIRVLKAKVVSQSSEEQLLKELRVSSSSINNIKIYSSTEIESLYSQGLEIFKEILENKQNNQWANNNVGFAYYKLSMIKNDEEAKPLLYKALDKLNKAKKLGLKDTKLFINLGKVYRSISELENNSIEKMEESIKAFREAYKINGDTYDHIYGLGASVCALGELLKIRNPERAVTLLKEGYYLFQKAFALGLKQEESIISLGYSLSLLASIKSDVQENIFNEAINNFKSVIKINPENVRALTALCYSLKEFSKFLEGKKSEEVLEEAIINLRKLSKINHDEHNTLTDLGQALVSLSEKKGNSEAIVLLLESKQVFKKIINQDCNDYLAIAYCGVINAELLIRNYKKEQPGLFFHRALDKFDLALKIKPLEPRIINMWINSITKVSKK